MRKFALLYPNNPNANQAASEFKSFLKADCGLTFTKNVTEFQFNDNPARAADEGTTIAVRLKQAKVTSVIYLIDFLGALFHIIAFDNQNYRPEFIWNGTGAQTNTVQRAYEQSMVDKASHGLHVVRHPGLRLRARRRVLGVPHVPQGLAEDEEGL